MEFEPMLPIWAQVVQRLESDIVSGRLSPGAKLPGTRDLALQYTINPNTAARVYQEMESAGLCETRRGLGTFVTRDGAAIDALRIQLAQQLTSRYLRRMADLGLSRTDALRLIEEKEEP